MAPGYTYAATLHRLIDGDTAELAIDLGFHVAVTVPVRFANVWAPERRTQAGVVASAKMAMLLRDARITVRTRKTPDQSFGRYVAEVWVNDERLEDVWHGRMGEPRQGIGVA